MLRPLIVLIAFCTLFSCTQRVVCPAYESAFIHDKDALRKKFSYFVGDSTPKVLAANKNKYLVAEPVSYKKKVRSLQTVEMRAINPVVPDSLKEDADMKSELISPDSVDRNVYDSTAVIRIDTLAEAALGDSIYVISKDRETRVLKYDAMKRAYYVDTVGFNTQQDNYMWYLRDVLVLPDVRISQRQPDAEGSSDEGKKEKRGLKGLFKKKDKKADVQPDQLAEDTQPQEEEDYGYDDFEGKQRDTTAVDQPVVKPAAEKKKKSLFKKAADKKSDKKKKAVETAPKKEEEDDDGF